MWYDLGTSTENPDGNTLGCKYQAAAYIVVSMYLYSITVMCLVLFSLHGNVRSQHYLDMITSLHLNENIAIITRYGIHIRGPCHK